MRAGLLFRPGSLWIGAHWSPHNRRWCINLLPCVTFWFTLRGGTAPGAPSWFMRTRWISRAEAEALYPPTSGALP